MSATPARNCVAVKFKGDSSFAEVNVAARKLIEIANATEAVQDGCTISN
jgi:hypothetical protein